MSEEYVSDWRITGNQRLRLSLRLRTMRRTGLIIQLNIMKYLNLNPILNLMFYRGIYAKTYPF
jgi:hypothetical protein